MVERRGRRKVGCREAKSDSRRASEEEGLTRQVARLPRLADSSMMPSLCGRPSPSSINGEK